MWFEELMGFSESRKSVYENIVIDGSQMRSLVNGKSYTFGHLEVASLYQLRERVSQVESQRGKIQIREEVADIRDLHLDEGNAGALFQVASQFNLLEMVSPHVTPEDGVSRYAYDHTQGPVCAMCAGAGTIYRNYFAEVNGARGQSKSNQIDCLKEIGSAIGNEKEQFWKMQNGYALLTEEGLKKIDYDLQTADEGEEDILAELLDIGIQWDTQVTAEDKIHTVTQVYCSALPIAYVGYDIALWERFARVVLYASYEATLCIGILNAIKTGNSRIYLTLVGGGVFGNKIEWIVDAIVYAVYKYRDFDLDIVIVSYGARNTYVSNAIEKIYQKIAEVQSN